MPPEVRFFFICLMLCADTEGRCVKDCFYFLQRITFRDMSSEDEVNDALLLMEANGLIIIYPYESEGYAIELIQIVDYHKFQAGKSYVYGSSSYPAPEGYVVEPPAEQKVEKDEHFQAFYNSYPKKYKKKEASEAWAEIDPDDATYLNIMNGLSNWVPYYGTLKKKDIPNPSVFLKNKIYLTNPPINKKNNVAVDADEDSLWEVKGAYPDTTPF